MLDFTPDTSEQLRKTFHVESGTWGVAFGGQGDYTPTDSADEFFVWTTTDSSIYLTFFADGTYKYEFITMNVEETGTWIWTGWNLTDRYHRRWEQLYRQHQQVNRDRIAI